MVDSGGDGGVVFGRVVDMHLVGVDAGVVVPVDVEAVGGHVAVGYMCRTCAVGCHEELDVIHVAVPVGCGTE